MLRRRVCGSGPVVVAAADVSARRTFFVNPTHASKPGKKHGHVYSEQHSKQELENIYGHAAPQYIKDAGKGLSMMLDRDDLVFDRRAYGVPFITTEKQALDAAMHYHNSELDVVRVERLLMPFWLGKTYIFGKFKADVILHDEGDPVRSFVQCESPNYEFCYPLDEYQPFNQLSASYKYNPTEIEKNLSGMHIPSMLISRFELVQECEAMKIAPTLIPFQMSAESAVERLARDTDKHRVEYFAKKELRKYHGRFKHARVHMGHWRASATNIRPVFLPMYTMWVRGPDGHKDVPVQICATSGKAFGPRSEINKKKMFASGAASAVFTGFSASLALPVQIAGAAATIAGVAGMAGYASLRRLEIFKRVEFNERQSKSFERHFKETDENGYKWCAEDEELHEYEWREQLRDEQIRKEEFEETLKNEAYEEEVRARNRKFKGAFGDSRARRGKTDPDPKGYYAALDLDPKKAEEYTSKQITVAFRTVAQKYHPDLTQDDDMERANRMMTLCIEAYTTLRDATKKKEYDIAGAKVPRQEPSSGGADTAKDDGAAEDDKKKQEH